MSGDRQFVGGGGGEIKVKGDIKGSFNINGNFSSNGGGRGRPLYKIKIDSRINCVGQEC